MGTTGILRPGEWRDLIIHAASYRPPAVNAHTYLKKWGSASEPVLVICDDGREYVVKGRHKGKQPVNDQIIARIGRTMGCPTGQPALVELPAALIVAQPELSHIPAGVNHGSLWIKDCTDKQGLSHHDVGSNRRRFAHLSVLFGLTGANDAQYIYTTGSPVTVYSVDHGHFFPGGPDWTVATLGGGGAASPDSSIISTCGLTPGDVMEATQALTTLTDVALAEAIAAPPDQWTITADERVALATYIASRRDTMLAGLVN